MEKNKPSLYESLIYMYYVNWIKQNTFFNDNRDGDFNCEVQELNEKKKRERERERNVADIKNSIIINKERKKCFIVTVFSLKLIVYKLYHIKRANLFKRFSFSFCKLR